jgi:hypothetical protein
MLQLLFQAFVLSLALDTEPLQLSLLINVERWHFIRILYCLPPAPHLPRQPFRQTVPEWLIVRAERSKV